MMERIVLDTNCLVSSFSRQSPYFKIWEAFFEGMFTLCVTNEIVMEYEEILTRKLGHAIAENIIKALLQHSHTKRFEIFYHFGIIKADPDDNKFVDCAIVANVRYIVTEDRHYNILRATLFPRVDIVDLDGFMRHLQQI